MLVLEFLLKLLEGTIPVINSANDLSRAKRNAGSPQPLPQKEKASQKAQVTEKVSKPGIKTKVQNKTPVARIQEKQVSKYMRRDTAMRNIFVKSLDTLQVLKQSAPPTTPTELKAMQKALKTNKAEMQKMEKYLQKVNALQESIKQEIKTTKNKKTNFAVESSYQITHRDLQEHADRARVTLDNYKAMDIRLNHQLMLAQQPPSVVPTNLQQAEQHVVKAELKITGIKELQKVYEGAEPQEAFREQLKQAKEELQNATEQVEQMQPQESVMKADDAKDEVEEEELEQEEELALASEVVEDEKAEHEEEEDDDDEYLEVIGINKKTGEPVLHALDIHNAPKKEPPKPEKAPDNAVSNVQKKKM